MICSFQIDSFEFKWIFSVFFGCWENLLIFDFFHQKFYYNAYKDNKSVKQALNQAAFVFYKNLKIWLKKNLVDKNVSAVCVCVHGIFFLSTLFWVCFVRLCVCLSVCSLGWLLNSLFCLDFPIRAWTIVKTLAFII